MPNMPYDINEEKIEDIKNLNDIVDVINEFLPLKRAGASYKTCCPFHKEKTPSFIVSPDKQIFHCFGCGENGDVINFIMKYNNFTFAEAIEYLAKRSGVVLEKKKNNRNDARDKYTKILYKINREAAFYYYNNLLRNPSAINYLNNRKIENKVIKRFGLGYAIKEWDNLLVYLKKKGYEEEDILKTGLIIKNDKRNSYYDRFRGRIIYPIVDTKKRVIGFGGRVLDNSLPKYINSPDSIIFNKGKNLYGLNIAKEYIKDNSFVLTEGYMDVIKMHSYGYNTAVASLGTALTENQIYLMKKYTKKFYIAYDSDRAGLNASLKAINMLKRNNIDAKVIIMPNNNDPDEFITEHGKVKFDKLIEESLDYFDFLNFYYSKFNKTENKIDYINSFFENFKNINSSIERELILEKLAIKTGISKESVVNEYNRKFKKSKRFVKNKILNNNNSIKKINSLNYEDRLLEIVFANNDLIFLIEDLLINNIFIDEKYYNIFKKIFDYKSQDKQISTDIVKETNEIEINYNKIEENKNLTNEDIMLLFKECKKKIIMKYYEVRRRENKEKLNSSSNELEENEIMLNIIDLDKKMKKLKEEVY